ncbi:hypothetical protein G3480_13465 [Thiorhodococcus mannitoliphagus]|uniref:Uncharacterized protein n=1 Tax=Thiorhodococcus mannitoliphagus TaxID=329406 RepID=A0A6P1DU55_9GAMM|nr:hypothetical protein [Thiorhodococcus mannitoliphagus]NEX21309.1 hypothetical protein [Thiorhodococcus mannitoliphagus]
MKRIILSTAIALFGLSGCGDGMLAPEGAASNAFLDKVDANCGKLKIGNQPINYLLDVNGDDVYFIDETSKLYAGEVDQSTYTTDINGFYPTDTNQPALDCIFDQLN